MLNKLKEYKEIITIIVFFFGGFFGIEARYVHSEDFAGVAQQKSLRILECKVDEYMKLTQLQTRARSLNDEIHDLAERLPETGSEPEDLSRALSLLLEQAKTLIRAKTEEFVETSKDIKEISNRLELQSCLEA